MVFTGADDDMLQNCKVKKFTVFVRSGGEGGGAGGGGMLNLSFVRLRGGLPKLNKCKKGEKGVKILGVL